MGFQSIHVKKIYISLEAVCRKHWFKDSFFFLSNYVSSTNLQHLHSYMFLKQNDALIASATDSHTA